MKDSQPMQDQANQIVTRLQEIDGGGLKLDDKMKALLFLSKVPDTYQTMVSALIANTELNQLTPKMVQERLLAEESVRRSNMGGSASKVSQVKGKSRGPCSHCKKPGHDDSHCWQKHPHLRSNGDGGNGSSSGNGNNSGGNNGKKGKGKGRGNGNNQGKNRQGNSNSGNQSGNSHAHTAPQSGPSNSSSGTSSSGPEVITLYSPGSSHVRGCQCSVCLRTFGSHVVTSSEGFNGSSSFYYTRASILKTDTSRILQTKWIMDSGASRCITNNFADFKDFTPYRTPLRFWYCWIWYDRSTW